ncbi:hypothetical protein PENSOL_c030G09314 [Penicillium solitum]|uniref:Uncharacterized protein n=1 Tax=Penicillium solitum TaxID=60172 RepID=A0A1V6QXI5_9EURO|nr:uncharacterized protein PENSOL_c030G09314 [Penicillium solitum]OQD93777.1 hypothetical protein PENSOL_c030G09314 [Penicillium solitum]
MGIGEGYAMLGLELDFDQDQESAAFQPIPWPSELVRSLSTVPLCPSPKPVE